MVRDSAKVGIFGAAVVSLISYGLYLDLTDQDGDSPPADVPPAVEFGDGYGYGYERQWGK
jgi:hypothetical protein